MRRSIWAMAQVGAERLTMACTMFTNAREETHHPLRPYLKFEPRTTHVLLATLNLTVPENRNATYGCVFANLANIPFGHSIYYSRDRNFYAKFGRYRPPHFSYDAITNCIDDLHRLGIVDGTKMPPSPHNQLRSFIKASKISIDLIARHSDAVVAEPFETVVLKSADGNYIQYPDTPQSSLLRREIKALNADVSTLDVSLDGKRLARAYYRRIFTQSWSQHGRIYGPAWQNLPSEQRRSLRIAGEPVVELDYRACHPRILAALAGKRRPDSNREHDPYELGRRFPREHVKKAFAICLNAATRREAHEALVRDLFANPTRSERKYVRTIFDTLFEVHPYFQRYAFRGFGMILMNLDSEICLRNHQVLSKIGIPCLSVHDSFIVPVRHEPALDATMEESFEVVLRNRKSLVY
jgi:hypothetical protein